MPAEKKLAKKKTLCYANIKQNMEECAVKKGKKRVITIVIAILAFLVVGSVLGMYFAAASVYDRNFRYRCTTSAADTYTVEQFPGLARQRHTFRSNAGQQLVGYLYVREDTQIGKKAVIVCAHGLGGGGQTGYMDIFDFFTTQGFYVFAYDATGNDESEGKVIGGLPQGFIDLDHAINYVGTIAELQGLPVMLMGYSWGAFSVSNVLNYHPEAKAVAAVAGWDKSADLTEHRGRQQAGEAVKWLLPFVSVYEHVKYGRYAGSTAMKGFANSDCDVMIVHGEKDTVVPIGYGYDTYFEKYGEDPRFTFKKYKMRGHDVMDYLPDSRDYALMEEIAAFFDKSIAD